MNLLIALSVLVVVAVLATLLATGLNRPGLRIQQEARAEIRRRLGERPDVDLHHLFCETVSDDNAGRARRLVEMIAKIVGVSPSKLAPEGTLRDWLSVPASELPNGKSYGSQRIEPFTYEILQELEALADSEALRREATTDEKLRQSEEGLAEYLMSLRLNEVITKFSPLVR